MAGEIGSASDPLDALDDLLTEAYAFDFFEAMRRIECSWPGLPRLGTAIRPADEPVRLGQIPSLDFAPSMLASAQRTADNKLRIQSYFLGLHGPQGPLPLHLTEYVHDRMTNGRDRTLAAFTDIFHHRMYELFYRAWANNRPTVAFDRPDEDRFATYLAAFVGLVSPGMRNRDAWPDQAKIFYAGLLSSATRSCQGLEALLTDYLGYEVHIEECVGEWIAIVRPERMRLGDRETATLGRSVLGEKVWSAQHKVRIRIGPLSAADVLSYRAGSSNLARLRALVMNYLGMEYAWDVQLVARRAGIPPVKLGDSGYLGWSSWLAPALEGSDLDDVIIDVSDYPVAA